jgi:hypothetical protein
MGRRLQWRISSVAFQVMVSYYVAPFRGLLRYVPPLPDHIALQRWREQWLRFLRTLECKEHVVSKCLYTLTFTSWRRSTARSKSWERRSLRSYDVIARNMTSLGSLRALSWRTVLRKVQRSRMIFASPAWTVSLLACVSRSIRMAWRVQQLIQ